MSRIVAVVPARGFEGAKRRLAGVLDADARARLAEQMLTHTVRVALEAGAQVVVATDCARVSALATHLGASTLLDPPASHLSQVVRAALRVLDLRQPRLVLMADLPWLSEEDLDELLDEGPALAPDHHGTGTNALFLPPGLDVTTWFGFADSGRRHLQALPARPRRVCRPGLARDLDTPEDWAAWGPASAPALRATG